MVGLSLLLSACGKKDTLVKDVSKEVNNETYNFSRINNIESLSDYSSDSEVAQKFIHLITNLNAENKTEGIVELLREFEKQNYKNSEVAECVAGFYWSNKDEIMQLINDSDSILLSLDYYGPVEGIKKVESNQIKELTDQMILTDKIELWKKINESSRLETWKDMIPFTQEEVSDYTSGMTLNEKLTFIDGLPYGLDLPYVITAEDVNTYIEKNNRNIYTSSGHGGYYDEPRNRRFNARNRKIMSNGSIYTDTAIRYLGDFAVIETEIEYLDSYYKTRYIHEHTMYFRDTEVCIEGDVDIFKYAPPYLFSITENKTEIFDVDNNLRHNLLCLLPMYHKW